jgi:hypothetical protein
MPYTDMAERLLELRTPGEIAISPDGRAIAFSVLWATPPTVPPIPRRSPLTGRMAGRGPAKRP